jgi:predicted RNA-binding Zn-ribbon protein involved in translation (DUF1610 family)
MTTTAIGRPLRPAATSRDWWRRINWTWWLQRAPMALLAVPAAYGVYAFSHEHLPFLFAAVLGVAFEATYLGAVAMADQQLDSQDWVSTTLWWLVNVGAVAASIISNLLFVAGGHFAGITAESFAHALPMPILGFLYGLMLHRNAVQVAETVRQEEAATRFKCPHCGIGKPSEAALNGHKRHCAKRIRTS